MADLDLNELERLEKAATPGPWVAGGLEECGYGWLENRILQGQYRRQVADYALIAATRNALPELLRRLRAAEADAERWQRLCELWAASVDLRLRQDEEGTWSITQLEDVEGEVFQKLVGDTPDGAIDAARGP